jgi:protein TonB
MEEESRSTIPKKSSVQFDIRRLQVIFREAGLVLSLGLLVLMFRAPIAIEQEFVVPDYVPMSVELEEIEQTRQIERPPAPPRPPVPIEVPNDEVLEDEILDIDAEIDLDEPVELPPPPPPTADAEDEGEPEIFVVVEEMPEIIGGLASLYAVLEYPELARKAGIEGLVIVQLVIEPDGKGSNLVVAKSANNILDAEALRAVSELSFKPGRQRGKAVRVKYAIPVRFTLRVADSPAG